MSIRSRRPNSGLASAINNAISRVGPQLAGAVIFVAITATFYAGLAARVPGSTRLARSAERGLAAEPACPSVPPDIAGAAHEAIDRAYHLAMFVAAGLLFGAAVNAVGIQIPGPSRKRRRSGSAAEA